MASPARCARRELRGHRPTDRPHPPQVTRLSRLSLIPWRSRAPSAARNDTRRRRRSGGLAEVALSLYPLAQPRDVPNATRGWEAKPDHHAETSGEIGAAVNHPLWNLRAREKRAAGRLQRHLPHRPPFPFCVFPFCVFLFVFSRCGAGEVRSREVGVAGAVRAPRATGSSTNRSAASAAGDTAQSPSLFIPWRSRAPSAAPNDTRRRRRFGRTGGSRLFLSLGAAARRAERHPRVGGKTRSSRGDIRGNWGGR